MRHSDSNLPSLYSSNVRPRAFSLPAAEFHARHVCTIAGNLLSGVNANAHLRGSAGRATATDGRARAGAAAAGRVLRVAGAAAGISRLHVAGG